MTSGAARWAAGLARVEDLLRARGLTGAQAFDQLLPALERRLGLAGGDQDPAVDAALAALPAPGAEDLVGLAYERFFPDLFKGLRGQFFTPPPLARWLVQELDPRPGEVVLDPTCGSGGLLLQAARPGVELRGADLDPRLVRLAALNLAAAGRPSRVERADVFLAELEPADVVIANPPFSVAVTDPEVLARFELGAGRSRALSDLLFAEVLGRLVRPGGRAGVVMPWSFLANPSFGEARARLLADFVPRAVAELPEGVFRPFGGAAGRACLLWLSRRPASGPGAPARFTRIADPGYDVRSRHLRPTRPDELEARLRGDGWEDLPPGAWLPEGTGEGIPVGSLAEAVDDRRRGLARLAELADVDPVGRDLAPREEAPQGPARPLIRPGDLVVSRLRPELGNVAISEEEGPIAGSPEWIVLRPLAHPRWLLHALRAPAWRRGLPLTQGQTRPRTSAAAVLASRVRAPPVEVRAEVDRCSRELASARRRTTLALRRLQEAVDRHAAGELEDQDLAALARELLG